MTWCCIASGPSLADWQIETARLRQIEFGWKVCAINDNWRRAPFADVLYAHDYSWWKRYVGAVRDSGFAGQLCSADGRAAAEFGLTHVIARGGRGLGRDCVHYGSNSGYQAINLAYLRGHRRIVLIGYDMQRQGGKDEGRAHWFGRHPPGLSNTHNFQHWREQMDVLAADLESEGVEVINCTIDTALTCFKRGDLRNVY